MKLVLQTELALHDIQDAFMFAYPGLRLFFFFDGDENLALSNPLFHSFSFCKVHELFPEKKNTELAIDETFTLKETEELFDSKWNLPARIYSAIDGYWQRSRKHSNRQLGEFRECPYLVNKEGFLVCPG